MQRRWIVQAFAGSVGLNVILLGILFYVMWKERPSQIVLPYRPSQTVTPPLDRESYQAIASLPYDQLLAKLEDRTPLRGGYRVRDIALGILVSKHDLDVNRGLHRQVKPRAFFGDGLLFPRLRERDYGKLATYLATHEAPFTPRGLFKRLPKTAPSFCVTDHYLQVETLLHRLIPPCATRPILLALCQEAGWQLIDALCCQQREEGDYTPERARRFLIEALGQGSRQAAYLLVISSPGHCLDELDDYTVARVLDQLDVKTKEGEVCCRALLKNARAPVVHELALRYLGETKEKGVVEPAHHIVQAGESVWLIAKRHGYTVDQLLKANPQAGDALRPGMKLVLPSTSYQQ